ncbi:hypothetical protein [Trinickia acidisoli]|uniref:hypothetical protein n=1 Tax=Trinickia acidisoli TaxID=2767482 RepID=UPI001A8C42C2|nr:hypothetical protein [Trinickia acidisoli]
MKTHFWLFDDYPIDRFLNIRSGFALLCNRAKPVQSHEHGRELCGPGEKTQYLLLAGYEQSKALGEFAFVDDKLRSAEQLLADRLTQDGVQSIRRRKQFAFGGEFVLNQIMDGIAECAQ